MDRVITYRLAYLCAEVTLCADHAETTARRLGPVQHGLHEGTCDDCWRSDDGPRDSA